MKQPTCPCNAQGPAGPESHLFSALPLGQDASILIDSSVHASDDSRQGQLSSLPYVVLQRGVGEGELGGGVRGSGGETAGRDRSATSRECIMMGLCILYTWAGMVCTGVSPRYKPCYTCAIVNKSCSRMHAMYIMHAKNACKHAANCSLQDSSTSQQPKGA
jgi:hypothetical protein